MTSHDPAPDLDRLMADLLALVRDSQVDPDVVPFACLLVAARVVAAAAARDEVMRLKLAAALVVVIRGIAPEYVYDLPAETTTAH